ncbi:MAG: hypothetical protein KAS15_00365, partial [Nanoarchaeota archaeon]|nr:hypothetical protein [Nanoarchaeota archaeon]
MKKRLVMTILASFAIAILFASISLADSTAPTYSHIAYRLGTAPYIVQCSNSGLEVISCQVGSESSPLSTRHSPGEGYVDIEYKKTCELGGEQYLYHVDYYNINWDTDQNDCTCYGKTWFAGLGSWAGSNYQCCGDDSASDDFSTCSGTLTTSTSVSCQRCLDGANLGEVTRYGNGYLPGSGTSRTCYYGDITCTASSAVDGASSIIYGWGWYSG